MVRDTSMCGLGQSAANPALSTLAVPSATSSSGTSSTRRCDAFVCKDLVGPPVPGGVSGWHPRPGATSPTSARGEYEDAYQGHSRGQSIPIGVCPCLRPRNASRGAAPAPAVATPIAIRALKRFITDRIEPSAYKPPFDTSGGKGNRPRIAVVGAGPAGLTTAHHPLAQGVPGDRLRGRTRAWGHALLRNS